MTSATPPMSSAPVSSEKATRKPTFMKTFSALTRAQWFGFWRQKQAPFWALLFPLIFLLVFGSIFKDTGQSRAKLLVVGNVAVVDQLSPDAQNQLRQTFRITHTDDIQAALNKVKKGTVDGALSMNNNTVTLHFSRADAVRAASMQGIVGSFVEQANIAASNVAPAYRFVPEQVEDKSLKAIEFLAPGLLGYAVGMAATFGGAMSLVNWRTSGLLRRIRLTPARAEMLVVSRTVVSIAVALLQIVLFLGIGIALYHLKLTGSWWMCIPLVLCATLAFMSVGLVAGAVSKTEEGASGLANLIILPMAFLSGSFIPVDSAPSWVRGVSHYLPLGQLNKGMMDVMVRGLGPSAAVIPMLELLGFALVFSLLAAKLFRWED